MAYLTKQQQKDLFKNVPYCIDGNNNSIRIITHEIRNKMDNGKCTHCGTVLRDIKKGVGCANIDCIIYGQLDLVQIVTEEKYKEILNESVDV
jgi:hypothetical protein